MMRGLSSPMIAITIINSISVKACLEELTRKMVTFIIANFGAWLSDQNENA
jgi:hypothetical protein